MIFVGKISRRSPSCLELRVFGLLGLFIVAVALANAVISFPSLDGWCMPSFPSDTAIARESEASRLADFLAAAVPLQSYFIAINLNNNADIMEQLRDQLLVLAGAFGRRLFVSIWENGSTDDTPQLMQRLAADLAAIGVGHTIVSDPDPWGRLCAFVPEELHDECASQAPGLNLRLAEATLRIPLMAAIRNMALLPLFGTSEPSEVLKTPVWDAASSRRRSSRSAGSPTTTGGLNSSAVSGNTAATHLGFEAPTVVVFLNDILFRAADVVELVATNRGSFDLACAMDFDGLKLYDEWVARDLAGQTLSPWYPFVREPVAQARIRAGLPFRVFSCWNGAVALPATAVRLFRGWREGEPSIPAEQRVISSGDLGAEVDRMDAGARAPAVWSASTCPVSECHVLCKDLWEAGLTRIYMNPHVRLVYSPQSRALVATLLGLAEFTYLSWANRIGSPHHALRSHLIHEPVGRPPRIRNEVARPGPLAYDDATVFLPPTRVSCGLSGDNDL